MITMLKIHDSSYVKWDTIREINIKPNTNLGEECPHDIEIDFIGGGHEVWEVDDESLIEIYRQLNSSTILPLENPLEDNYV